MIPAKIPLSRLLHVCCWALLLALSPLARAQSAVVDQFLAMPQAERERLMREVGISPDDVLGALRQGGGRQGPAPLQTAPQGQSSSSSRSAGGGSSMSDMGGFGLLPGMGGGFGAVAPQARSQPPASVPDDPRLEAEIDYGLRHGLSSFRSDQFSMQELFSIPAPDDYVIGPGDAFYISLFGKESGQLYLPVQRDGWVDFPDLGTIPVAGLTLAEARRELNRRIEDGKIGVEASVALEQLKSVQVSVTGEVREPGVYVVPALVSISQVLTLAGGPTDFGALRRVQLIGSSDRAEIDLYDHLLRGGRADVRGLQSGDTVHVPMVDGAVQVTGAVRRAGVYEVLDGEVVGDLLQLAGGLAPRADPSAAVARRYDEKGLPQVIGLDLASKTLDEVVVSDGMTLWVPRAAERTDEMIELAGEFTSPGVRAWRPGMTLGEIFADPRRRLRLDRVDLELGYLVRIDPASREPSFVSFSIREVMAGRGRAGERLQPRDVVLALPLPGVARRDREEYRTRRRELASILRPALPALPGGADDDTGDDGEMDAPKGELTRQQSAVAAALAAAEGRGEAPDSRQSRAETLVELGLDPTVVMASGLGFGTGLSERERRVITEALQRPAPRDRHDLLEPFFARLEGRVRGGQRVPVYTVMGEVRSPGTFPVSDTSSLHEALRAAGGLRESADTTRALVLRKPEVAGELRVFTVDLAPVLRGESGVELMPGDVLTVRTDPTLAQEIEVEIGGEVASPGSYRLPAGARLSDILELAGGVTERADLRSAVFSRARLRAMEADVRARYLTEIRQSVIAGEVAGDSRTADPAVLELMNDFQSALDDQSNGRLQIDLPRLAAGDDSADLELSDGDRLRIPSQTRAVSVAGQVRYPGSFAHMPGMSVDAYLEMAGGISNYADEKAVFIVRGSGAVELVRPRSGLRFTRRNPELLPGDRIVVPINYDYVNRFDLAKEVVQFVYQAGIGLAAVVAALDR